MKKYLLLLSFLSVSCLDNKSENDYYNEAEQEDYYLEEEVNFYEEDDVDEESYYYEEENDGYEDGTYSATVYYHNPETSYSATYTLDVDVEDNEVITIYFPKGGYLDEDHIWPGELDEDGYVLIDGEEGKTYEVYID